MAAQKRAVMGAWKRSHQWFVIPTEARNLGFDGEREVLRFAQDDRLFTIYLLETLLEIVLQC